MTHYHRVLGPVQILRPGNTYDRGKEPPEVTVIVSSEDGEIEVAKRLIEEKKRGVQMTDEQKADLREDEAKVVGA